MKKTILFLFLGIVVHTTLLAQTNNDKRLPPPPPPPKEDDGGMGFRRGAKLRPEQREKIEMFKIQFITKKLELTKTEAESFWPVYDAHKKAMQEIIKTKMNDEISMQEAMLSSRKKYKADLLPVLKTEERVNKALRIEREFLYKMRHEVSRRRGWPQE